MSVARISDYQKPRLEVVEHRVADTDDGFMRVANELTDSILMADLTARQLKVMLAIMRKTYGFNKAMDRLTNTQIAAMTGIHHTHVCVAKRQLLDRGFLIGSGQRVGINKHVSMWDMKSISQVSETLATSANKTLAKSANTHLPTQLNTKDNIQKTINTNTPLPPKGGDPVTEPKPKKQRKPKTLQFDRERFKQTWNTKASKCGLPTILSITKSTEQGLNRLWSSYLRQCKELGKDPRDVDSILNGYIEHGYQPTAYAMGDNPDGKKYGIDTALTQKKIDQILGAGT